MFGTTVDTAIGLVLVFLLFAILVSTAMEVISGVFALRAKALENTIAKLVEDPTVISFWAKLWTGLFAKKPAAEPAPAPAAQAAAAPPEGVAPAAQAPAPVPAQQPPGAATPSVKLPLLAMFGAARRIATSDAPAARTLSYETIYNHALVAGASGNDHPSYVPAANFAAALVQVLGQIGGGAALVNIQNGITALPDGDLKTTLQTLLNQAGTDLDKLRTGIETWFDGAMDRLSGQYKRFTQIITFVVALVLAIVFNVDAIHVTRTLAAEPALASTIEAAAEQQVKKSPPPATNSNAAISNAVADYRSAAAALATVGPIGWPYAWDWNAFWKLDWNLGAAWNPFWNGILGWLLTAFAAMMGAPFWFGILSSLVNARNAGPKPNSSTSDSN